MAIYQGAYYSKTFILKNSSDGSPVDITGWEFRSMIRDNVRDVVEILELTTANGGWVVVDGPSGLLKMAILAAQTSDFPVGTVVWDVFRTDVSPGPIRLFGCKDKVRKPVTRE